MIHITPEEYKLLLQNRLFVVLNTVPNTNKDTIKSLRRKIDCLNVLINDKSTQIIDWKYDDEVNVFLPV